METDGGIGHGYVKASAKYGWYYRDVVLPALERQLQTLERKRSEQRER